MNNYHTTIVIILSLSLAGFICLSCKKENGRNDTAPPTSGSQPGGTLPRETIILGDQEFRVELAFTRQSRYRGLMFRRELPANTGMLFVFGRPKRLGFHMENCLIDLDIIFITKEGTIDKITTMKAPTAGRESESYRSKDVCKYALEIPAGTAAELKLATGQQITFPRRIRTIIPESD